MVEYEPAMAPMHLAMIGTRGVPAAVPTKAGL